jgi:hypothetical protein
MAKRTGIRWLLLLGLSLLTVVVVLLFYDRLVEPTSSSSVVGLAIRGVTAQGAFDPAAELAAQWQKDARLTTVSCQWSNVGTQRTDETVWAFQFFSPSTQRLALITVADGAARMVRDSLSPYSLSTFSAERWRVDSDQALRTWWNSGGSDMANRHPDTDLAMHLHMSDEGGNDPIWTVVGFVSSPEMTSIVVVNGADGSLVGP